MSGDLARAQQAAPLDWVTVAPAQSDAILANPDMGWETFHRTREQDRNLPAWIPSTVQYLRWGWAEVEPSGGRIDEALIDRTLQQSRDAGQKLAFRVMCCSTTPGHPYHPAWLAAAGGRLIEARYDGTALPIPDLDDPRTLALHLDLIKRLGMRYDGHADLSHVDLGSVGWWGEWHYSGDNRNTMISVATQERIIDAYVAAFRHTPLVMLIGGGESLGFAVARGAGWRADCLGDMGGFSGNWCHMRKGYPVWFAEQQLDDVWKQAPVAWETCWDMRKWVAEGWSLRYIFNYALALHASYINNKSAPLPEGAQVRGEVERFLKRLGYRLVLNELRHPALLPAGADLQLTMNWQNLGSAPCYRPYRLAYRLTGPDRQALTITGATTVEGWLPGSVVVFDDAFLAQPPDLPPGPVVAVAETIRLPRTLAPGSYELAIAVVGTADTTPIVQLGIAGRAADGWYPLSRIEIEAPSRP